MKTRPDAIIERTKRAKQITSEETAIRCKLAMATSYDKPKYVPTLTTNKSLCSFHSRSIALVDVQDGLTRCTAAGVCGSHYRRISYISKDLQPRKYCGRHMVALLSGDGVGPEILGHVKNVFSFINAPVDFEEVKLSHSTTDAEYDNAILAVKRNHIAIKGNVDTLFDEPGFKMRNLALRTELDLFANVVWCKSFPGVKTRHKDIDLVVIRENTEGEYRQLEHETAGGVVESLKIITEKNSTRIAKYAFEFAKRNGRKKITAVHKANIMKLSDGLFLECCRKVSEDYPDIEFEGMIVDNCSMQLVSRPHQFDVMVLPNLYGNIITSIGAGLIGGAGLVAGVNLGDKYAVFETGTRTTGHAMVGQNIANPAALLLASADMLRYLGLVPYGDAIKNAVHKVIDNEQLHTPDLGGDSTTTDFMDKLMSNLDIRQTF
ncbi:Isocitrate dehydrogenase [NAD] subunit gamma, mitochondrial [Lamellibrachia satsuma]|nr:Isocitrate dehydrogenase [NAD] subunit gamma, mitochondrial [Lamellibrachia satsuma]